MRKFISLVLALAFTAALISPDPAAAQSIPLIRDAEIENTIRAFATPLFEAAGLDPSAVGIHIVGDDEPNAFVLGGQNLFITTGLLLLAKNASQVIGVIAHETGHIAGGHLARMEGEQEAAQMESILAFVLGAAAMVAGGPQAGQAIMMGGQQVASRQMLAFSREHEGAADQAGVTFLDRAGESARGFAEFLELLAGQELLAPTRQDPYVRTHPITQDRIEFIENHVAHSKFSDVPTPPAYVEAFARMQAKLVGFLKTTQETLDLYPESDTSLAARYARAIAYYRKPDLKRALPLIDGLLAEEPDDPFFSELKGQMLFENGRVRDAIPMYEKAAKYFPDSPLILVSLAQAQLETNDPSLNKAALANLQRALHVDARLVPAWGQLAVAQGRMGDIGLAALALAEKAYLLGDDKEARAQVARAQKLLPRDSSGWLRAEDIKQAVSNRKKK
ncbi:MAG: M48 family metalloprotease [Alphaproteobacteria bacterium]